MTSSPDPLLPALPVAGRVLDAQLHLLDRQVLDHDGVPVTTVDDLELSGPAVDVEIEPGTAAPVVTALLTGPVLGTRIFGGRPPSSVPSVMDPRVSVARMPSRRTAATSMSIASSRPAGKR